MQGRQSACALLEAEQSPPATRHAARETLHALRLSHLAKDRTAKGEVNDERIDDGNADDHGEVEVAARDRNA